MIHRGKIQAQQSISDMLTSQGDMIVRYYGTKAVEGFERDAGQVWRGRFQRGEIEKVLSAIIQASGTLLDIHPRNSLEALFDSITGFTG
jgi:ABC-2 type transport system ATP-binding protein